jgi:hypothetical protein
MKVLAFQEEILAEVHLETFLLKFSGKSECKRHRGRQEQQVDPPLTSYAPNAATNTIRPFSIFEDKITNMPWTLLPAYESKKLEKKLSRIAIPSFLRHHLRILGSCHVVFCFISKVWTQHYEDRYCLPSLVARGFLQVIPLLLQLKTKKIRCSRNRWNLQQQ